MVTKENIEQKLREQIEKVYLIRSHIIIGDYQQELDLLEIMEGSALSNNLLTENEIKEIKNTIEERMGKIIE